MKVVVLHGSAHRGGDSDALVDRLLAGMGPPKCMRSDTSTLST